MMRQRTPELTLGDASVYTSILRGKLGIFTSFYAADLKTNGA
jgi:hypothetical protein